MLYLASTSPRRKALLSLCDVEFETLAVDVDESVLAEEKPNRYVERLSIAKAKQGLSLISNNNALVIGSDTCCVLDDVILGKPHDKAHAVDMLSSMSARTIQVMSGVAVVNHEQTRAMTVVTDVEFKPLSLKEIERYWDTGEPVDKAGAFGIQGIGAKFIKSVQGSYTSVVGLPLVEVQMLLDEMGYSL